MIDMLIAYNVNTRPLELIKSTASVDVFFRSERERDLVPRGGMSKCTLKVVHSTLRQHFGNNDDMSFSYRAAKSRRLQNRRLSSSSE